MSQMALETIHYMRKKRLIKTVGYGKNRILKYLKQISKVGLFKSYLFLCPNLYQGGKELNINKYLNVFINI